MEKFIGCVGGDVGDTERAGDPAATVSGRFGRGGCFFCSIRRLAVKRRDPDRGSMRRGGMTPTDNQKLSVTGAPPELVMQNRDRQGKRDEGAAAGCR